MNVFAVGAPTERLRSELHRDGLLHARYPTALLTLCGRSSGVHAAGCPAPTCGPCRVAAGLFDRVDGSMPQGWVAA